MNIKRTILALCIGGCALGADAEDIDLFVGSQPGANGLPNVLFIIDNTANWNQAFSNEMSALATVFNSLPVNADNSARFNVGIMLATETGSPNTNISGGYVRAAMRPMTGGATGNRKIYADLVLSLDKLNDKGNGGFSALNMVEAYRYFGGGVPYAGNGKIKTDFTGNTNGTTASRNVYALPGNALSSMNATTYYSTAGAGCGKNYIIYISNGPNQESSTVDQQANTLLQTAGGTTTMISLPLAGSQGNPSDEWARFMKESSLGITTYTVNVDPPSSGQGPGWTELLKSMANVGGGKPFTVSSAAGAGQEISDAVNKALSEIQAVNSVFASVSLPLSVNAQGTYLNQVFVGLFRPDADGFPRWQGNLKQFQIGQDGDALRLVDADGEHAINSSTGFITECARSYWTPTATDSYWAFRPQSDCIPPAGSAADLYKNSNFPDGNVVEKGAQAYTRRASTSRTLKTCSTTFSQCTSLTDFATSNSAITAASLGATVTSAERDILINWARGLDVDDENQNGVTATTATTEMRPSVHGDIVHSRPVAIDFGSQGSPKVVVFYSGNDGVLRAINGNQSDAIGSVQPGEELWGFVPPEFYPHIKRLRDNTVQINFPNIVATNALPKPYAIDGAITAHNTGSNVWLYAGMRRGGRALYAFDVNDSNPSQVSLKWKVGCPDNFPTTGTVSDTGCTSGLSGIGQTWSSAKPFRAQGSNSELLIMGGGYDPCEDTEPNTCTAATKGNKIYVLDADNGTVLSTLSTSRAVIADVSLARDPTTGLAVYGYVGDLGGNVYRITMGTDAPGNWTITKIASLGCNTTATCAFNRKFMFAPSVVRDGAGYDILLGSGDREKPRNYGSTIDNYFFMIQDHPTDGTWLSSEQGTCGSPVLCLDSLTAITTSANPTVAALAAKKGWYLGMRRTEQVVTSAITIFGTATFSTHQPSVPQAGVCTSSLGTARVYNISYLNAAPADGRQDRSAELPGSIGLPPSPVGGNVDLGSDDGTENIVPFLIGCDETSPMEACKPKRPPPGVTTAPKSRVYWYIER